MAIKIIKKDKKLYHITKRHNQINSFTPRIPSKIAYEEDETTPRICTSTTIEGCLNALPRARNYDQLIIQARRVFKIFVFHVKQEDYISSQELEFLKLVPDVKETDEHWLVEERKADMVYYISYISGNDSGNTVKEICYQTSRLKAGESFSIMLVDAEKEIPIMNALLKEMGMQNVIETIVEEDFLYEEYEMLELITKKDCDITLLLKIFFEKINSEW